jgi:predicted  nucleic acid-binding Zn-ribbon protein
MLASLLHLQSIERQLAHVRGRLKTRRNAVAAQEKRIAQAQAEWQGLHDKAIARRKDADRLELDLRQRDEQVAKYRTALNAAKTNKEYAAVLTQINTLKADNAKLEEEGLKIMQEAEGMKAQADQAHVQIDAEQKRLADIQASSDEEIRKLDAMVADLSTQRSGAAAVVPPEALRIFERVASNYEGDAMAVIEVHGRRPPHDYICGGCYMALNAEHANALRSRDEIRTCANCGRILYLETSNEGAAT